MNRSHPAVAPLNRASHPASLHHCPVCDAPELKDREHIYLRMFKVELDGVWWSQCLRCAGYYTSIDEREVETPENFNRMLGWFDEHGRADYPFTKQDLLP